MMAKYLSFPTESTAASGQNVIWKLGSRALFLRENYTRDALLNVIPRNRGTGQPAAEALHNWSTPRQTSGGAWVIRHPEAHAMFADSFEDTPITLATGWAEVMPSLDVGAIDWSAVATAVGLNPLTFDPAVEITLSGENWVRGAFVILGLAFVEMEDPDFPE